METIGFIGLGIMGAPMAGHLLDAGCSVVTSDHRGAPPAGLTAKGLKTVTGSDAVAKAADIVITMVPDTPQVDEVLFGENGVASGLSKGKLVIDMSSISPIATKKFAQRINELGCDYLDAPVSGGPIGAKNATLTIMAGGEAPAFARAEPFFRGMGTTITHVGAPGAGQAVKLCNQLICGINIQAVCEAIALGRASGVDLEQMRSVLLGGSAASWMLDKLGPAMIAGDAGAGFRIDLMLKDLRLVQEQAQALSVSLPGTALVTSQYIEARAHGEGGNGNQALFRVYDRMTNRA